MIDEAKAVLDKISALNKASDEESNDAEIDAAHELKEASLALVRKAAEHDVALAELVDEFDRRSDEVWNDNAIQFPRLLAEIHALITPKFAAEVAASMDLQPEEVYELLERATDVFEEMKPPIES